MSNPIIDKYSLSNPIVVDVTVNGKRIEEKILDTSDLFRVIYEILPVEVSRELDDYIEQLELRLETVSTELELYGRDIEYLENQLEELRGG